MKKLILLFLLICSAGFSTLQGEENRTQQRLTPAEFRAKQQSFLAKHAELTQEESLKFFPLYFELQDKKKKLNDEAWQLLRKGRKPNTTEQEYENIIQSVYDKRIAIDMLEKNYFNKFKKIITCKKIYQIQEAEVRFHREMLRGMRHK